VDSPAPAQADAWLNLATDQVLIGQYTQARHSLDTANRLLEGSDPINQLRMILLRAEIALRAGNATEARRLLKQTDTLPSDGVLAGGYQARGQLMLAELARNAGDPARAAPALDRAQALIADSQTTGSSLHAALLLQQGLLNGATGDWEQSEAQVAEAIESIARRKGAESPATLLFHAQWIAQLMQSNRHSQAHDHAVALISAAKSQLSSTAWASRIVHQASQLAAPLESD